MATTPLKAIKEKCLDCCFGNSYEVKMCPAEKCPIWPFRQGKNPYRSGQHREMTEEQRALAAERLRLAREKQKQQRKQQTNAVDSNTNLQVV